MGVNKEHKEFHILDVNSGWDTPRGYPKGIQQKILSGTLDEANRRGTRTRLLRFAPGVFTTAPFVHEYWEEVFLVQAIWSSVMTPTAMAASPFRRYACRPPGAYHGQFKSNNGCVLFEIHYFDPV
jgi:hypothetical protein